MKKALNNKLIILLLFGLIAALIVAALSPAPFPKPRNIFPPALPRLATLSEPDLLSKLLKNNIWSQKRQQLQEQLPDEIASNTQNVIVEQNLWELVAILQHDGKRQAVISGGNDSRTYLAGEELPDGSAIVNIMSQGMQISKTGIVKYVYLFDAAL